MERKKIEDTENIAETETRKRGEGKITKKAGSNKLYVDFMYFNKRLEKSTGQDDTPENREKMTAWLDRRIQEIKNGTFRFSTAFPNAPEKEKAFFAQLEGWQYKPESDQVLVKTFIEKWIKTDLEKMPHTTKVDYYSSINPWILPHLGELTFFQLNSEAINDFEAKMVHPRSAEEILAGTPPRPFSKKRIKNVRGHLRRIWSDACERNRWSLPSPFPPPETRKSKEKTGEVDARKVVAIKITEEDLKVASSGSITPKRLPLRMAEWEQVYKNLDEWYRPIAELMVLTGTIPSELAGLCEGHIANGHIHIRQIISRGMLYKMPKTESRIRDIPLTKRVRQLLDEIMSRQANSAGFIITGPTSHFLDHKQFWKEWSKAVTAAGINYRVPYCLRHTFAAWALCVDIHMNQLVALMGHSTKQMVYEVYGKYTKGLEQDRARIVEFFGDDFMAPAVQQYVASMCGNIAKNDARYAANG